MNASNSSVPKKILSPISYHFSSKPYFKLNLNLKENFDLTLRDTKGGRGVVFVGEGHVLIIVNY